MSKSLVHLFYVQFFGALNDNIFKNALVILVTYHSISLFHLNSKMLVAFLSGLFILPFFLFSALSAEVSLKYSRTHIVRMVKVAELLIMLLASIGFFMQNYYLLMVVLFLLGTHSTFLGPIKYSLIPEFSGENQLVFSNALISAGTFMAILLGTIGGGVIASHQWLLSLSKFFFLLFALLGCYFAFQLPLLPPLSEKQKISRSLTKSTKSLLKSVLLDREVIALLIGLSWFWFLGAGILTLLPAMAHDVFHGKETVASLMLFIFTIGMGLGPFVFEKFFQGKVYRVIIPSALFLISFFIFDLSYSVKTLLLPNVYESLDLVQFLQLGAGKRVLFDLFLLSFFSGIFTVVQYAELQRIVAKESLTQVVAGNNILNAFFMVVVSLFLMLLFHLEFSLSLILGILGMMNMAVGVLLAFFHDVEFNKLWRF